VPERPYHHGNLRAALLAAAEKTLREEGADQVSLRALAREAGVSHGAPRRHFPDRQALLDALAADGYERLADTLTAAVEQAGEDFGAQFRAGGTAFVGFAVDNAALIDLMLASRPAAAKGAPERPYLIVGDMVRRGQEAGRLVPGDPEHLRLLVLAMFQGIAELITSRRVPAEQAPGLVTAAAALFVRG
jgi:AcrR family transcriptional regulator